MSCPYCGDVEIRWGEQLGQRLYGECRACGTVYGTFVANDIDMEGDVPDEVLDYGVWAEEWYTEEVDRDPDEDENDPAFDESEEWTFVRDGRL